MIDQAKQGVAPYISKTNLDKSRHRPININHQSVLAISRDPETVRSNFPNLRVKTGSQMSKRAESAA